MSKIIKKLYDLKDGSQVIIRSAMKKDAPEIIRIKEDVSKEIIFTLVEPEEFRETISTEEKRIKGFSKSDGKLYLVAETGDKLTGFLEFDNFGIRKCRHNGLFSMYLDAQYRDKGIGRRLLDALTEWGNEHPFIEKLSLYVFSNNTRARALYEKTGWVVEGICKDDMKTKDGEYFDSVLMAKFVKKIHD